MNLLEKIEQDCFDYQQLIEALDNYKKPRDKIRALIEKEVIVRIKKGLYIFGPKYQKKPIHLEVLGNLIYGPSYISLEYALSFYNLIPERVERITSITTQRAKTFKTPLGQFSYTYLNSKAYPVGISNYEKEGISFLIATPEKALCDLIAKVKINILSDLKSYLFDDLRLDTKELAQFQIEQLKSIALVYNKKIIDLLLFITQDLQHE